jgi:hypothetical protein
MTERIAAVYTCPLALPQIIIHRCLYQPFMKIGILRYL